MAFSSNIREEESEMELSVLQSSSLANADKDRNRDESFESSTAVIEEAQKTAARLQSAHAAPDEDEFITAEEAVALWKRLTLEGTGLGESKHGGGSSGNKGLHSHTLERRCSLFDAAEAGALTGAGGVEPQLHKEKIETTQLVSVPPLAQKVSREMHDLGPEAAVRITVESTSLVAPKIEPRRHICKVPATPLPPATAKAKSDREKHGQTEHKDFFEAVLDTVGVDKMCGVDEETLGRHGNGVPAEIAPLARALAQDNRPKPSVVSPALEESEHKKTRERLDPPGVSPPLEQQHLMVTGKASKSEGRDTLERFLDSLGVDTMCGADEASLRATLGAQVPPHNTKYPPLAVALVTPIHEDRDSFLSDSFPKRILDTDDIFANANHSPLWKDGGLTLATTREHPSRDIFSNEFAKDDFDRGSVNAGLWNRLSGLCEPLELELPHEAELETELELELGIESGTETERVPSSTTKQTMEASSLSEAKIRASAASTMFEEARGPP